MHSAVENITLNHSYHVHSPSPISRVDSTPSSALGCPSSGVLCPANSFPTKSPLRFTLSEVSPSPFPVKTWGDGTIFAVQLVNSPVQRRWGWRLEIPVYRCATVTSGEGSKGAIFRSMSIRPKSPFTTGELFLLFR